MGGTEEPNLISTLNQFTTGVPHHTSTSPSPSPTSSSRRILSQMDCIPAENSSLEESGDYNSWGYGSDALIHTEGDNRTGANLSGLLQEVLSPGEIGERLEEAEGTLYSRVVVCVCVAGLVGNILNMTVLTHRRLRTGMSEIEGTVYLGLAALSVSDMMFCACAIPHAWVPSHFYYPEFGFSLFYTLYSESFINIFVMCSAWLTVTMAMSRYIAICYPLHARALISRQRAYLAGGAILMLAIVCNLPRFWKQTTDTMACVGDYSVYFLQEGIFRGRPGLFLAYTCAYFLLGTVIPFSALVFCNLRLISALKKSLLQERDLGQNARCMDQSGVCRVTLTLVLIVAMYMVLVVPVEVSTFVQHVVVQSPAMTPSYNLILAVLNVMQASNFAFHFVLYCIVNVHFRRTVRHVFKCATLPGKVTTSFKEQDGLLHKHAHSQLPVPGHLRSPSRPVVTDI